MMQVILGALHSLCPPEGIALLREYLYIHRLSQYLVHTGKSLRWFEDAIKTFFKMLRAPGGLINKM